MTTVAELRDTASAAVRSFASFYRANATLIDALPNADEMHAIRLELLALIKNVSDDVELVARDANAAEIATLTQEVADMIETLRARRAELEHWLGKTSKTGLFLLALGAAAGLGLWYAKKNGMLGGLAEEDCGCGR